MKEIRFNWNKRPASICRPEAEAKTIVNAAAVDKRAPGSSNRV